MSRDETKERAGGDANGSSPIFSNQVSFRRRVRAAALDWTTAYAMVFQMVEEERLLFLEAAEIRARETKQRQEVVTNSKSLALLETFYGNQFTDECGSCGNKTHLSNERFLPEWGEFLGIAVVNPHLDHRVCRDCEPKIRQMMQAEFWKRGEQCFSVHSGHHFREALSVLSAFKQLPSIRDWIGKETPDPQCNVSSVLRFLELAKQLILDGGKPGEIQLAMKLSKDELSRMAHNRPSTLGEPRHEAKGSLLSDRRKDAGITLPIPPALMSAPCLTQKTGDVSMMPRSGDHES